MSDAAVRVQGWMSERALLAVESGGAERTSTAGVTGALVNDTVAAATLQLVARRRYLQLLLPVLVVVVVVLPADVVQRLFPSLHVPSDAPTPPHRRGGRTLAPPPVTPTPPTPVARPVGTRADLIAGAGARQVARRRRQVRDAPDDPSVII